MWQQNTKMIAPHGPKTTGCPFAVAFRVSKKTENGKGGNGEQSEKGGGKTAGGITNVAVGGVIWKTKPKRWSRPTAKWGSTKQKRGVGKT